MWRWVVLWLSLSASSAYAHDLPWLYSGVDAIVDQLPEGIVAPDAQPSVVVNPHLTITLPVKASRLPQSLRDLLGRELMFVDFAGKPQCTRRLEGFVARSYIHASVSNLRRVDWSAPPVHKAVADENGNLAPTFAQLRDLFNRNTPRLVATFSGGCDAGAGIITLDPRPLVTLSPITTDKALVQTAATMARATRMWQRLQAEYARSRDAYRAILRKRRETMAAPPRTWDAEGEVTSQLVSGPNLTLVVLTFGNGNSCRVPRAWFAYQVHTLHLSLWSWGVGDQPTFIDADHDGNYEINPKSQARLEAPRTTLAEPRQWRTAELPAPRLGAQSGLSCHWDERTFVAR